jgi:CheY-like chemotaxis protein
MEQDDDDTVYCDIQMPVDQGRELLEHVNKLRESKDYPSLDTVFEHRQHELSTSIDIVDNPPSWGAWGPTHH